MIYTEITPNPTSLKFVTSTTFLRQGSADFPTVEEAGDSPLAQKLFDFAFVDRVFISANFVTVTKHDQFQWEEIIPMVKDLIKSYLASEEPVIIGKLAEQDQMAAIPEDDDEITRKIKEVLETHVRPAVAYDGGDIVYEDFVEGILKLKLLGSCSGCPSSVVTLKDGIEGLMTRLVPEVKMVEAV
ncbi:MAG: NifU family protein [Bacteroidota bacterium]